MAKEAVKTRTSTELRYPARFNVVIYNDDFTPVEFVITLLVEIFNINLIKKIINNKLKLIYGDVEKIFMKSRIDTKDAYEYDGKFKKLTSKDIPIKDND